MASVPEYLSFNDKISPSMGSYQTPGANEMEEMRQGDPPLKHTWTIWEQIMATAENKIQYADSTHKVASFGTVKGFWTYWNHLPQPSVLLDGNKFIRESQGRKDVVDALMLFREGIKPEWEDEANASGGHFQFQLKPDLSKSDLGGGLVDEYWNNIVLGMIGATVEPSDMITGVRLVDKLTQKSKRLDSASIRIEVWFRNMDEQEKVDQLKKNLERCMLTRLDGTLGASSSLRVETKPHSSSHGKK